MFSAIIIVTENQRALLIWDCADISSGSVPSQSYNTLGINPEDLDLLSRTVLRLGGYAEGLFDFVTGVRHGREPYLTTFQIARLPSRP